MAKESGTEAVRARVAQHVREAERTLAEPIERTRAAERASRARAEHEHEVNELLVGGPAWRRAVARKSAR